MQVLPLQKAAGWYLEILMHRGSLRRINAIVEDSNGTVWIARSRVGDASGPLIDSLSAGKFCKGAREMTGGKQIS